MIDGSRFNSDKAYQDSKLCNVMTTLELAHQLQAAKSSVTCNCMSPGLIPTTGLFREYNAYLVYLFNFAMTNILQVAVTEEEGGRRLAYMIASPDLEGKTGLYFARNPVTREFEPTEPSAAAKNPIDRARLWSLTQALLDKKQ
jgi:protochlorophyllide reductase